MTQPQLTEAQQADKFKNRRQLAWISFWMITIFGAGLILVGVFNDEAQSNISALSFLLGTVFGVWASIVLSYVGAATINQMNERRYSTEGQLIAQEDSLEVDPR